MRYITTLRIFGNGRVTIPDYIRAALNVKQGDLIKVIIERADIDNEET